MVMSTANCLWKIGSLYTEDRDQLNRLDSQTFKVIARILDVRDMANKNLNYQKSP